MNFKRNLTLKKAESMLCLGEGVCSIRYILKEALRQTGEVQSL